MANEPLSQIVQAVLASPRYRHMSEDLVRAVAALELARRRSLKEATRATKSKLHQVGGAYLEGEQRYKAWIEELRAARGIGEEAFRQACRKIMAHHSSTRERLPILDDFYEAILAEVAPVNSVLDIACGMNPLSIPWMPLAPGASYHAYDIYMDMMEFLGEFMSLVPIRGRAEARDVISSCPTEETDVALLLKAIPCLEQVDKSAGLRLLESVRAKHLVVSFPVRSLGGKNRGMPANYESRFRELVSGKGWTVKKFEFATELAFRVSR
jgi:16S rRNA (guanine(1405)-N(7))-methyltransferase